MNETIELTHRQNAIVALLSSEDQLSREEISQRLPDLFSASKATLARDIAQLVELSIITQQGSGPSTTYTLVLSHPLLKPIDLALYFHEEPDLRTHAKKTYDPHVLEQSPGVITLKDQTQLDNLFRSYSHATSSLDHTTMNRELERYIIELSWKSSKIEGNTYTLLETETLLKQGTEAEGRTQEETQMILNHKDAFKSIARNTDMFKTLQLSRILELHGILAHNLPIGSGIRKHAVGITGTTYRPIDNEWQIREAMEQYVEVINNVEYPLEKALLATALLSYIQPFADGNKRTGRMLANAILLAHDYFPLSYRSVSVNEYKEALIVLYETGNLFHIKRLFLEQYRFALDTYFL